MNNRSPLSRRYRSNLLSLHWHSLAAVRLQCLAAHALRAGAAAAAAGRGAALALSQEHDRCQPGAFKFNLKLLGT
jgi:hypothetical protein